ncbi:cyclophilin-like domain-containing protein [Cladochytrium replicatum]|nr:cyclophilin-like domain-containing protein [Cladochytrium replicatum]
MSSSYVTEPPTKGKVVLRTTGGDLEVELWAKEAPKACRNFVQLCLEGYYDGTIFHRIVKNFIVQGGDPTGTGMGGESIYGAQFNDEFHSRLRFSRRGIMGMANTGQNTNSSQFFFTLDQAEELNRKNTVFGKIVGDTIFNLMRIGELEVDENEKPLFPVKILSVIVLSNPFDDIEPRARTAHIDLKQKPIVSSKLDSKKLKKKNVNVLSFEEDEISAPDIAVKIRSSHDVLDDPKLSNNLVADKEIQKVSRTPKRKRLDDAAAVVGKDDEETPLRITEEVLKVPRLITSNERISSIKGEIQKVQEEIKSISSAGKEQKPSEKPKKQDSLEYEKEALFSSGKAVQRRIARRNTGDILGKLQSFRSKLKTASAGSDDEEADWTCHLHGRTGCQSCRDTFGMEEGSDKGWRTHKLKFTAPANVYAPKVDDYAVFDPRDPLKK